MKLFKKISLFSIALLLGFGIVSCKKNPREPEVETISVADTLAADNNSDVSTKGVVFAKTTEGIYINDGTGSIFVVGGTSANVKDEVTVNGIFGIVNKRPEVKNATVEVVAGDKETLQPIAKTVVEIASLGDTVRTNYACYYTTSGTVAKDNAGAYYIGSGEKKLAIDTYSNTAELASFVGNDVTLDVITCSNDNGQWTVSFCKTADDITLTPVDLEACKAAIFAAVDAKIPAAVYGELTLPTLYKDIPNVIFTWSVKSGEGISITNNKATVTTPTDGDKTVKLELKLSSGDQTATKEYEVTNKVLRAVAIADLGNETYDAGENVIVTGKVILNTRSNGSFYSNIIMDEAGEHFARIDSSESEVAKYKVGDEIKVIGEFKVSNGVQCIIASNITKTKDSTSTEVKWDELAWTELVTEEDYIALADRMDSEKGIPLTLFKIANPYITTSDVTGYNYLRFGPTATTAKSGVTAADNKKNTASMSLLALQYILGETDYNTLFQVGNYGTTAIKNVGITLYAFCGYNIEAITTGQFVFAKEAVMSTVKEAIVSEINNYQGEIDAHENGRLELPKSIANVAITWTTNCPSFNLETGEFAAVESNVTYTFTAKYTVDGEEIETSIEICFKAAPISYISVSDFNDLAVGSIANVEGTILGFATRNNDENNARVILGMYLSDGQEIAYVEHSNLEEDATGSGYTATYVYGAEKTKYAIGDVMHIKNTKKSAEGITLSSEDSLNPCEITVTKKADVETPMVFAPTEYSTVQCLEDFNTAVAAGPHKLIKVVGGANVDGVDNYICFGSSVCTTGADIYGVNKVRIYYYHGQEKTSIDDIKPDGTHVVATKCICSELNIGNSWWTEIGRAKFSTTAASTGTNDKFIGEFYCALTLTSKGFYMVTMFGAGFNLTKKPA